MLAAIAIVEALAPVVPDGWDAHGRPVGKPWSEIRTPWVQVAATTETQTMNAYEPLLEMIREGPIIDTYHGIEPMKSFVALPFKGKIEFITSESTSREGNRPVFCILDQALALDTPIPTPSGWTTMGELEVGDRLFGTDGQIVRVTQAKPVSTEHDCFRVTFADGTSVIASEGHLWWSKSATNSYYKPAVRTTGEMLRRKAKFRVPVAPAQVMPEEQHAVPPYLLGLWLGDGTRNKCEIAVSESDLVDTQATLRAHGVETWPRRYAAHPDGFGTTAAVNLTFTSARGYQSSDRPAVAKAFRLLPCFTDKHVPAAYLRGSVRQRTELVQGLMDADGSCTPAGLCTFVNTNERLADALVQLLRSLGQVTSGVKRITDDRYTQGYKLRVDFTPRGGFQPFALPRKVARVKQHSKGADWISITSIEPVPRVPVRCIAVDGDDHLFAAGKGGHLTHNTETWLSNNGGIKLAATLRRNLAKVGGTSIEAPNAYVPGEGSVAESSARFFMKIREGRAKNNGLLYDHREWPPDTDLTNRESLLHGLGIAYGESADVNGGWVDLERLVGEIWDPDTDPQDARRYYGNAITHAQDSWLSQPQWAAVADPLNIVADDEMIALGFDGSRRRAEDIADATALIGCRISDGHLFPIRVWEQPDNEIDWWAPTLEIDATVRDAFKRWNVVAFYADPAADWRSYVAGWEASFHDKLKVKSTHQHPIEWWMGGQNLSKTVQATLQFHSAVANRELTHDGSSVLTRHVLNARRRQTRAGIQIAKDFPTSPRKIDAAVAAILAWQARLDAIGKGVLVNETKKRSNRIRRY